jgi:hypothetical protein
VDPNGEFALVAVSGADHVARIDISSLKPGRVDPSPTESQNGRLGRRFLVGATRE